VKSAIVCGAVMLPFGGWVLRPPRITDTIWSCCSLLRMRLYDTSSESSWKPHVKRCTLASGVHERWCDRWPTDGDAVGEMTGEVGCEELFGGVAVLLLLLLVAVTLELEAMVLVSAEVTGGVTGALVVVGAVVVDCVVLGIGLVSTLVTGSPIVTEERTCKTQLPKSWSFRSQQRVSQSDDATVRDVWVLECTDGPLLEPCAVVVCNGGDSGGC